MNVSSGSCVCRLLMRRQIMSKVTAGSPMVGTSVNFSARAN